MEEVRAINALDVEAKVMFYQDVARVNGSVISLSELTNLIPENPSEQELENVIESSPLLSSRLEVKSGYVVERVGGSGVESTLSENAKSRMTARVNMSAASDFVALIRLNPFKMISVSGSTSYNSASKSRDVDLFCVSPSGKLWLSVTHGLIMARIFSLLRRKSPQICFSCVMDEAYAEALFRSPQDALFARDAMEAKIIRGGAVYGNLLRQASWIPRVYPSSRSAIRKIRANVQRPEQRPSPFMILLNGFLFVTVGTFIKVKSRFLNGRLIRRGEEGSEFTVRSSEKHLIYESKRYLELRRKYEVAFSETTYAR